MCNDHEQYVAYQAYVDMTQAEALPMPAHQSDQDLPQLEHVRIRDVATVMRLEGDVVHLRSMRWGFPPERPGRGGPVFNFRSEGRSFANSRRCLIPASAF